MVYKRVSIGLEKLPNRTATLTLLLNLTLTLIWAITPFKVIQGHGVWYQSKAHMQLLISD